MKFSINDVVERRRDPGVGMTAKLKRKGFRRDGSYRNDRNVIDVDKTKDYSYLKGGETFNAEGVRLLADLLVDCRARGVYVVGVLPPVRHVVCEQLRRSGYRYADDLPAKLSPFFNKYGFSLYDFSDLASLGASDDEAYDDFHVSEKAFLRLFVKMLRQDKRLTEYGDPDKLQKRLDESADTLFIYKN